MLYINGAQNSTRQVKLDGTAAELAVTLEADASATVVVSLETLQVRHNFEFKNVNEDKEATVDFGEYSYNMVQE